VEASKIPFSDYLEKFKTKIIAEGVTSQHIRDTVGRITTLRDSCRFNTLADIDRNKINEWIAKQIRAQVMANRTINT